MAASDIQTAISAGVAAMEAGDYEKAILKFTSAMAYLIGSSDNRASMSEMKWGGREFVLGLIRECKQKLAASSSGGGEQTTLVEYVNPTT